MQTQGTKKGIPQTVKAQKEDWKKGFIRPDSMFHIFFLNLVPTFSEIVFFFKNY